MALLIEVALTLLLALHLLCMNAAAGGPLVAAWLDWRAARGDAGALEATRYLARHAIGGFAAGALLGLAIGWLSWTAAYQALWLGPLSYKLRWAAIEAGFSLVLLVGWWLWLPVGPGGKRWAMATRGLLALLSSTNLLYHFPPLFAVAAHLYDGGQTTAGVLRGAAFREQMLRGETLAMLVHVALASIAVAGVLLLGLALRWRRRGDEAAANRLARAGGWWALVPTVGQLPVGLWTLAALAPAAQMPLMGSSGAGVLLLVGSLCAALWLARELAGVALGETGRPALIRAMTALLVTVVLMTAMQRQTRAAHSLTESTPSKERQT